MICWYHIENREFVYMAILFMVIFVQIHLYKMLQDKYMVGVNYYRCLDICLHHGKLKLLFYISQVYCLIGQQQITSLGVLYYTVSANHIPRCIILYRSHKSHPLVYYIIPYPRIISLSVIDSSWHNF